jgi:hypothetical protein
MIVDPSGVSIDVGFREICRRDLNARHVAFGRGPDSDCLARRRGTLLISCLTTRCSLDDMWYFTDPGREVPKPLTMEIRRGTAGIEQVMRQVMLLTKLNFNAADFCDGLPITLRFAQPARSRPTRRRPSSSASV